MILTSIYNQTITILNKCKQQDSNTTTDLWYKTVLHDAAWYSKVERTVSGSTVAIGSYISVLIPYHAEFMDYKEWKLLEDKSVNYTISAGDYVILGEIEETEITSSNIISITAKYEPDTCQVKYFQRMHERFGSYVQLNIEGT